MVILIPGNGDKDNDVHKFLVERGYNWGRFEQPRDGIKRKYWKQVFQERSKRVREPYNLR